MYSSRNVVSLLHLPKILYNSSRHVRGGVTVELKKVKPLIPRKKVVSYSDEEFRKLRRDNKGIAYSIRNMAENNLEGCVDEDPEEFTDPDMDVFDGDRIYQEQYTLAEKEARTTNFFNIKRKYFKEKQLPNMLTYIEKQQIKYLNQDDPELWCVDKLAESFPASANIIRKVLKSKFTAYSVQAIQKHDKIVKRNWELFQNGKLSFDSELESHYAKFVGRLKLKTNEEEIKKYIPPPPDFSNQPIRDFVNVITSSKKYKAQKEIERKRTEQDDSGHIIHTSKDIVIKAIGEDKPSSRSQTKAHYTLDEFRKQLELRTNESKSYSDSLIVAQAPKKALPSPAEPDVQDDTYQRYESLSAQTGVVDKKLPVDFFDLTNDEFPLRINIPRQLWQRNKLYRVKDRFYDDQGSFVYRIPGLF